ncbi:MAG: spermidine/putrescine ABC transporter substrate-binding protein [Acidimicrobiales bacterium]|nr:spermidine/putrescine ABC transporter substrate-binding protein [Acidimicrobiales bacterium]
MGTTRRRFIGQSLRWGALLGAGVPILQACGGDDEGGSSEALEPIADGLQPEGGPLRIVNYADYVNPDVIAAFEQKYGVTVEISTIDSDTEMVTKLASGAIKADVNHSMSSTSIGRLIEGRLIRPLNKSYIPNYANIVDGLQDPWYDRGGVHSAAYTYFGTGIGYRADRIDPSQVEAWGWDTLWNAAEFKGQCSVLDDEREAFAMAMLRKGITDINTVDQAIVDQALADVTELIDLVNIKVNITGYTDIPQGITTIAHTWSADMISGALNFMPEGEGPEVLGFWHPPAGSYVIGNDSMGVMADAENPVLAHLYIDFLLDAAVAEQNFGWVGYLPAVKSMDADYVIEAGYVPENLRSCVPTAEEISKALRYEPLGDGDAVYEDAWSKFLAGA